MKLLEKLKNTFFEEEYVEVEEPKEEKEKKIKKEETKEEKKEEVAKKVETKEEKKKPEPIKIEEDFDDDDEEEIVTPKTEEDSFTYSDRELLNRDDKIEYFDDEDFEEDDYEEPVSKNIEPVEPKKIYGGSVNSVYDSIINSEADEHRPYGESAGRFHPTPIISPIYGVLDKNYRKEEVIDKKDRPSSYVSRKDVDLDSIRKKAYGDVSIFDTTKEEPEPEENSEPLLYDMIDTSVDEKPEVEKVTIADAEEYFEDLGLEYNVDYKDSAYEKSTGRRSNRSTVTEDNEDTLEIPQQSIVEEEINNITQDYDVPTEDVYDNMDDENLFDLVDSVYKGGEE